MTTMSNNIINSISEFLLHAGTQYRVFDLGRETKELETQAFLDLENGSVVCQRPRQAKAWFAICFSQAIYPVASNEEHEYVWFIALPIDENSKVITATRNHFLQTIIEALKNNEMPNGTLPDNPYLFTPTDTQRGQLLALVMSTDTDKIEERSKPVISYLNAPGAVDWRKLVTQDIYCAALLINTTSSHYQLMIDNWPLYDENVKSTLLKAFEIVDIVLPLQSFFLSHLKSEKDKAKSDLFLLALSNTKPNIEIQSMLAELLVANEYLSLSTLSVIAGRFYTHFSPGLVRLFLQACLELDTRLSKEGELFAEFYRDLVAVPYVRNEAIKALNELRSA